MQPIINILDNIKNAISNTRDAITKTTAQQNLIQNQYTKAKAESKSAHEDALKAAFKSDHHSAMRALSHEALQENFANILQSQIKEQLGLVEILNNNLAALIEVEIALNKWIGNKSLQNENIQSLVTSSFGEKVDQYLDNKELLSEDILIERVKKVISEQESIEVENISLDRSLVLGEYFGFFLSSSNNYDTSHNDLKRIELLIDIEEEFQIEISDAEAEIIRTVQELVNFISFKLSQTQTTDTP